jgi:hypothetical protein
LLQGAGCAVGPHLKRPTPLGPAEGVRPEVRALDLPVTPCGRWPWCATCAPAHCVWQAVVGYSALAWKVTGCHPLLMPLVYLLTLVDFYAWHVQVGRAVSLVPACPPPPPPPPHTHTHLHPVGCGPVVEAWEPPTVRPVCVWDTLSRRVHACVCMRVCAPFRCACGELVGVRVARACRPT